MSSFTAQMKNGAVICRKAFTLDVVSCPDWSTLLWQVPNLATVGAGASYFTPNSVQSASFTMGALCPSAPAGDYAHAFNSATIQRAGGDCNCRIVANCVKVCAAGDEGIVNASFMVVSTMFGVLLLNGAIIFDYAARVAGTYNDNVDFTIPDTGGATDTITFQQFLSQSPSGGPPYPGGGIGLQIDVTANVLNV